MPSAWLIGPLVIKSSLVIQIVSLGMGLVWFGFTSPFSKTETKKRLDEVGNLLIAFVISLFIGKIIINFSTFINDPLAILAYPSDSKAFYIAFLFTGLYAKIKIVKGSQHFFALLFSWINVFFAASFVYEFVQIIWGSSVHTWGYLGLLFVFLIIIISLQGQLPIEMLVFIAVLGWSAGQWLLSIFSNTTVFQFNLHPWFYGIICIGSIFLIIYKRKVKS
ncbi:hypothetical protein NC797_07455 [Aquibacillus sp. 3ASR75-11]|uniref:Uncharacterized protein n=1 Tax=Terrihalobacillus insolitus TaxID=2950438 RepID=A0A9X4AM11_9BACI|nr:hypothetical protein [Terrihalobacillus insolitus]MDC3424344.1 hypothetical protein [Terrihalobacillus insolitus]